MKNKANPITKPCIHVLIKSKINGKKKEKIQIDWMVGIKYLRNISGYQWWGEVYMSRHNVKRF